MLHQLKEVKPREATWKRYLSGLAFVAPNLIGLLVLTIYPIVYGFYISFTNWDFFNPPQFVGFQNYLRLLTDEDVRVALINTLYFIVGSVPGIIIVSLGLALLLNLKIKLTNFYRTTYFFPYISSWVAVAILWSILFNPLNGPINQILRTIGISQPPGWLIDTKWAMATTILVFIWKNCGYYMILFLAGLQSVPRELYEAADMDGANAWQTFAKITFPCLTPTTILALILATISAFKFFDGIYIMTAGGPGRATMVLMMRIFFVAFQNFDMGAASAISFLLFAFILIITLFQWKLQKHWDL